MWLIVSWGILGLSVWISKVAEAKEGKKERLAYMAATIFIILAGGIVLYIFNGMYK